MPFILPMRGERVCASLPPWSRLALVCCCPVRPSPKARRPKARWPATVYPWDAEITKGLGGNRDVAAMAKAARLFITQSGKRPFFLVYGFADPHRAAKGFGNEPFAKDPKEVRYDPGKVRVPAHLPDRPEVREELAEYYQSVSRMDRGVGLLLEILRELGQLDDTLIIFV